MPLKLLTLNIEGSRHRERVRAALEQHLPDVACLQEVIATDRGYFQAAGGYDCFYADSAFLPDEADPRRTHRWGLAILTRVPVDSRTLLDYSEDTRVRVLDTPNAPLAVDTIFATSAYSTSAFEVLDGLSDHKALLATVSRRPCPA